VSWAAKYIEQLKNGKDVTFRPRGNSMRPHIESGNQVTLHPIGVDLPVKGDIVLAKVGGNVYLHFVSAVGADGRYQIANASGFINGWTTLKNVYGRVALVVHD